MTARGHLSITVGVSSTVSRNVTRKPQGQQGPSSFFAGLDASNLRGVR